MNTLLLLSLVQETSAPGKNTCSIVIVKGYWVFFFILDNFLQAFTIFGIQTAHIPGLQ